MATETLPTAPPPVQPRDPQAPLAWATALLLAVYLIGGVRFCGDLAAAGLLAVATGILRCGLCAAGGVALFYACFPPLGWPLYAVCFAPLFYLWRYAPAGPRPWWLEATALGYVAAWLAAPFLGPVAGENGRWLQALGYLGLGCQFALIA